MQWANEMQVRDISWPKTTAQEIRGIRVVVHTDCEPWCDTNCAEYSEQIVSS
jgi:hypothetical protein